MDGKTGKGQNDRPTEGARRSVGSNYVGSRRLTSKRNDEIVKTEKKYVYSESKSADELAAGKRLFVFQP